MKFWTSMFETVKDQKYENCSVLHAYEVLPHVFKIPSALEVQLLLKDKRNFRNT